MESLKYGKTIDITSISESIPESISDSFSSILKTTGISSLDCGLISYKQAYEMQLKIFRGY